MADMEEQTTFDIRQMDDVHLHSLALLLEVNIQGHDLRWSDEREHTHIGSGDSQEPDMTLLRHGSHYDLVCK